MTPDDGHDDGHEIRLSDADEEIDCQWVGDRDCGDDQLHPWRKRKTNMYFSSYSR